MKLEKGLKREIHLEPLAHKLRPTKLSEIAGQEHLLGPGMPVRRLIENRKLVNLLFWSTSAGVGKTTLARCIASELGMKLYEFNATTFTVKSLREVIDKVENPLMFIDEISRLNQVQSDVLLPHLESGKITLIGAQIGNPYFSLQSAIISRCIVFYLEPLKEKDLLKLLLRAIKHYKDNGKSIKIETEAIKYLINISNGDGRKILSTLDLAVEVSQVENITLEIVKLVSPSKYVVYNEDNHFDFASAEQGSLQASDVDSAIYWLAAWLESGEDPRYIARRLMISASEDACSTPEAAMIAHSAYVAACEIGRPECDIILAHAVTIIASAKRDKASAIAIWEALKDVREKEIIPVPKELRDSHYASASKLGHGAYHDGMNPEAYVGIEKKYFRPW